MHRERGPRRGDRGERLRGERLRIGRDGRLGTQHLGFLCGNQLAELLFDVIATAYERNSLVLTTNLPFENWTEVLGSERLTGAA